jgi:DNA-binding Lrp family transcriptional regulator
MLDEEDKMILEEVRDNQGIESFELEKRVNDMAPSPFSVRERLPKLREMKYLRAIAIKQLPSNTGWELTARGQEVLLTGVVP